MMLRALCASLLSLFLLAACQSTTLFQARESGTVLTSPADSRDYAYRVLPNGLRVLLVSDPEAPKSAASLDVHVGSGHDPKDRQGLAHFLEHMLFLGTDKYPDASEYQAFITAHGGSHNAYTAYENTNYFFDVSNEAFPEALDRFAQFFIAPRFDAAYVEREKHAVHSEYQARIRDENRRSWDAILQSVNPEHPLKRFSVGSLETLADRPERLVRDDLLQFYERYYAAPIMALVVVSPLPLDRLESLVNERFGAVPSRPVDRSLPQLPLFNEGTLPLRIDIVPEQDLRELSLLFPLPALQAHYRSQPLRYLAGLLGDESEGSLLALLKVRGWADSLQAGAALNASNGAALFLDIGLTEAGLEQVDAIVTLVFQALNRIRQEGVQASRYREQAVLADLQFRFLDKGQPDAEAIRLASNLQQYPAAEVIRGDFLMEGFPDALLHQLLDQLTPDNLLMAVNAKGLPTDQVSPWFHAPYANRVIPEAVQQAWREAGLDAAIQLPPPNAFLPERLNLVDAAPQAVPKRVVDEPGFQLWYQADTRFGLPRGITRVALYNPDSARSPADQAALALYAALLGDHLTTALYPAVLAGIGVSVEAVDQGLLLQLSGFDDKQPVVLEKLVAALRALDIDEAAFNRLQDVQRRSWLNSNRVMPFRRLVRAVPEQLQLGRWADADKAAALGAVNPEQLRAYMQSWLQNVSVDMLVHGNYSPSQWRALADQARHLATSHQPRPVQTVRIPAAGSRVSVPLAVEHDDAAVLVYVAGADGSLEQQALMALSAQALEASFFNELRTEQQLGYAVRATAYPVAHVPGMLFVVQSASHDADAVLQAMQAYFNQALDGIDEAAFESHRQALIRLYEQPANNLAELNARLWTDLAVYRHTGFERREQIAALLKTLAYADWRAFVSDQVLGEQSRALLLYTAGRRGVKPSATTAAWPLLDDTVQWHQDSRP